MRLLFFSLLIFSSLVHANEISFLVIKSPGLSWASPRILARTTIDHSRASFGLGHVAVEITCSDRTEYIGMINKSTTEVRDAVLKNGNGLGVLFRLFKGALQNPKKIVPDFERLTKAGRTRFVTFRLSPELCARAMDYHDEYVRLNAQTSLYYGFPAMGRYQEGGGCSGFAMSFLEILGLKESWMTESWSRFVRVPKVAVGYPMRNDHVGLRYVYYSSPTRWARENESHFPLFFWDPDLMFRSIKSLYEDTTYENGSKFGALGVIIDRQHQAVPEGPLFVSEGTNPTVVYRDLTELLRRWEFSRDGKFTHP